MPDLKTALQSALNEWNQPETTTVQTNTAPASNSTPTLHTPIKDGRYFARTTDVSRSTFEYVRDNPHHRTREIVQVLGARGHNPSSVSSILSQMARTGLIKRDSDGTYWTNAREYSPVKLSTLRKERTAAKPKAAKPKVEAPKPKAEAPKPTVVLTRKEATPAPAAYDVDALIATLTIAQARDLFAALKRMFA